MENSWKERWDDRYAGDEYAYGELPNEYLKEKLAGLKPGKILFPAEGEGRNAVYAAKLGWKVSAFDISREGRKKAMVLAEKGNVHIDYSVGDLQALTYGNEEFDAIALIFAHFPAGIKSDYHKRLDLLLRKGGFVIFEAFSKRHLAYVAKDPKVGGPRDIDSLFSLDEIKSDFRNYHFIELAEVETVLNEGIYHRGLGSVIRFFAAKK